MPTKNNVTPMRKSTKSAKPTKANTPHVEPTPTDHIREIDQAAIVDGVTLDDLQRLCINLTDIVDELGDDATLPTPPEGYERCAECGLPTRVGGNGLCPLHDIHALVVNEPTNQPDAQQSSGAEETTTEPTAREERVFSPTLTRKHLREVAWRILTVKNKMPLVKPGAKDAEGLVLSTDAIGGTCGRVLVTYRVPETAMTDADARRQFIVAQLEKAALYLRAEQLEVSRATIEDTPYITVLTTRVPGAEDEKPAKRASTRGNQAAAAKWTVRLDQGGYESGEGI